MLSVVNQNLENKSFQLKDGIDLVIQKLRNLMLVMDEPCIVGVAGASASGKTSRVANRILEAFSEDVALISLDNYMKGDHYLQECIDAGAPINRDHPDFADLDLVAKHITSLKNGISIERPVYSFPKARRIGHETISPKKLIVVEGLYALHTSVAEGLDYKVFVESSTHGRIIRRLMRDVVERGLKPKDNLLFLDRDVEPMYSSFIEPTKYSADIILLNDYNAQTEARRAQVSQCQVKYNVTLDEETLRGASANRLASVVQKDLYLIPYENSFTEGELFRLRQEGNDIIICYKGPKFDKPNRIKAKFEFKIDRSLVESIGRLYNQADLIVEKNREIWVLPNGTIVSCDTEIKVTQNGVTRDEPSWIELQLPLSSEGHPLHTQMQAEIELNLNPNDAVHRSYDEIFRKIC